MSLKPGIGRAWLDKFKTDVYPHDYVIINGTKVKPPKYYDEIFAREDAAAYSEIVAMREFGAYKQKLKGEHTVERLAVHETVKAAQLRFLKRGDL